MLHACFASCIRLSTDPGRGRWAPTPAQRSSFGERRYWSERGAKDEGRGARGSLGIRSATASVRHARLEHYHRTRPDSKVTSGLGRPLNQLQSCSWGFVCSSLSNTKGPTSCSQATLSKAPKQRWTGNQILQRIRDTISADQDHRSSSSSPNRTELTHALDQPQLHRPSIRQTTSDLHSSIHRLISSSHHLAREYAITTTLSSLVFSVSRV
jgi:hypothetical protein